jgi:hypothetical protein
MRQFNLAAALLLLVLPLAARAQEGMSATSPAFSAMIKETRKFTITQIDKASRVVTVKNASGDTMSVLCGPEVKNFAQLRVGDEVQTTYKESLTIHVEGSGDAEMTSETMTARAKEGEKPSGSIMERTTAKATIKAIDKAKGTATLQTMSGEQFTVTADNKANLDKVKVGNVVVVTYTVANAISVSKPKATKSTSKTKG